MSLNNPVFGERDARGNAWNGFEWVSPERYDMLRSSILTNLPPMQPVPWGVPALPVDDRTFYADGGLTGEGDPMLSEPLASRGMVQGRMEGNAPDVSNLPPMQPLPGVREGKGGDGTGYSYSVDHNAVMADAVAPWHQEPKPAPCGNPECVTCAGLPEYTEEQVRIMNADMDFGRRLADAQQDEAVILELLKYVIGEDPTRGGLLETPARVVKAWKHWTSGYHKNPADILKVFEDGAEGVSEMVVVRDIPIYSHCEHHLAPIFGTATIGYLPNGKIVGLSKLNRLADMFARRLQVQERMTNQIADALMEHLVPLGCGVVINARHMCMESRGVQQGSSTKTSALRGVFKDDPTVRAEFLSLGAR